MQNVEFALYFNFWFGMGWILHMKEGHWIYGYGTMAVGLLICYALEDIVELVKWFSRIKEVLSKLIFKKGGLR